jgi:hypothetical protein
MKFALGWLIAAGVALTACSHDASATNAAASPTSSSDSSTVTVHDANGDTVTSSGKTVTVQSSGGTSSLAGGPVDPAKLGAPVYPGATANANGSLSAVTPKSATYVASFNTPDDFEKVYGFYKAQMPAGSEQLKAIVGADSAARFQTGDADKDQVTVNISTKAGATTIAIAHITMTAAAAASAAP